MVQSTQQKVFLIFPHLPPPLSNNQLSAFYLLPAPPKMGEIASKTVDLQPLPTPLQN